MPDICCWERETTYSAEASEGTEQEQIGGKRGEQEQTQIGKKRGVARIEKAYGRGKKKEL